MQSQYVDSKQPSGDRVVISGVSGLFPNARHVKDFADILYDKVDPIATKNHRWDYKHPELPEHIGIVPNLTRFDSQFFKMNQRIANTTDMMARKLLEQSYQAIYDAGLSPEHLAGRNVGVYVASCFSETDKACFNDLNIGYGLIGCSKSMFANRISYWLDLKGPSFAVDQSCCSTVAALEAAFHAMERGEIEAAIVGAGSLSMHPQTVIQFGRIIKLSPSGKTRSFDQDADGCVKSEAIGVLFLQRAKDALRIYADVVHVKSIFTSISKGEDGPMFGFYRDAGLMTAFLKQFYEEANVPPSAVEYVEAFGSGTPEVDKAELDAFDEVFCGSRDDVLTVGSVMSNIGYTEAASGFASITKVLLGYQKGKVAANLNCEKPRQDIPALRESRMVISTDHQPLRSSYAAINSLSYHGVNAHVLLHGDFKPKNLIPYKSALPRLVMISGRNEKGVERVFEDLKSRPIDPEEIALLHNIHEMRINGHLGRGYAIFDTSSDDNVCLEEKVQHFDDIKRPLWFVYSGMGSQWNLMGLKLMGIPRFASTIQRCNEILKQKGVDLIHILTTEDKTIFNNILHAFVGITAIQIALTDVLKEIGIVPDKIIGHSLGEVACAYADGAFTAEQALLASYSRGRVSVDIPVVKGSMAAVGLGYQQIRTMCPSDIVVACHNGPDSCTLSGPRESMKEFVETLTSKGIFAKEVQTCNIAFHSKYIEAMSSPHLNRLREIIPNPVARSDRWMSTSVPQDRWGEDIAMYSSAEYHNNNMKNPVLFEETLKLVPSNAVLIEIAPHGLLQAILKRSLAPDCRHIPLTRRGHSDMAVHVLGAVGRLYMEGYNPRVTELYPKVEFPVSTQTASLSHLVEWAHDEKWNMPLYISGEKRMAAASRHLVTLHDDEFKYLQGNVVRGRVVYPFAAALVAAWDTLAMTLGIEKKSFSVHFRNVHLFAQPILHEQRQLRLKVVLHRGTGKFEISDDVSKVATGCIIGSLSDVTIPKVQVESTEPLDIQAEDVYELMQERGFTYRDDFCSIYKSNASYTEAQLLWADNWVTFIDGMLQLNNLKYSLNTSQPRYIGRIYIDTDGHKSKIDSTEDKKVMTAYINEDHDLTRCGGIIMDTIKFHNLPFFNEESVSLKNYNFIPHFQPRVTNINLALLAYIQMLNDHINNDELNVVGIMNYQGRNAFREFKNIIDSGNVKVNFSEILEIHILENKNVLAKTDLVLTTDLTKHQNVFKELYDFLKSETFVLNFNTRPNENTKCDEKASTIYNIESSINAGDVVLELIKVGRKTKEYATVVTITSEDDVSLLITRLNDLPLQHGLLIVAFTPVMIGLKEKIQNWRREFENSKISMIIIDRNSIAEESLDEIPDLPFSVLKDGIWGGEYFLPWEHKPSPNYGVKLTSTRGDLKPLKWVQQFESNGIGITVNVHYAGFNNYDVKRATGIIPFKECEDIGYGMDFSGVTQSGSRVMGVVKNGAIASKVQASELLWDVPDTWLLEEAATVPLPYSMAFYCLKIKADLSQGMTVCILEGTSALGQAAIAIALAHSCQVFATVGDSSKKQSLLNLFPELNEKHVGFSRDIRFGDMVLQATEGKGCDIVLSCATGKLRDVALNCCAYFGITIDVVQVASMERYAFGLRHLTKQRSYVAADFSSILEFNYLEDIKIIKQLVTEGIALGYVKPLPYVTYGPGESLTAVKEVDSTGHRERVLVRLCDPILEAEMRFTCSPDRWQLLFCDGSLGIQFADELINYGARKILLCCPNQLSLLRVKMRNWKKLGIEVNFFEYTKPGTVDSLLQNVTYTGQIDGIFNLITKCDDEVFETVIKLDSLSRMLYPSLKKFLVISPSQFFGDKIHVSRSQDQVPVTTIHLASINIDIESTGLNSKRAAIIDAVFKILATETENVLLSFDGNKHSSLLSQLASISGVEIPLNIPGDTKLKDLRIPDSKMHTIQSYLRDFFNIYLEESEVPSLRVKRIQEIERSSSFSGFEDVKGLDIFYSYVDPDEAVASASTVFMETRAKYSKHNQFDVDTPMLCVIPGLEGNHQRFRLMCERLKLPAFTLQPGYAIPQESIQEMAARYAEILEKKMKIKDNFHLLGYESGVIIALETAKILEKQGLMGTIFCVGQAPKELKNTIKETIDSIVKDGTKLEDAVANHMVNLIKGENDTFAKIEAEVKGAQSWNDKLEICVEELVGHNGHTSQYIRTLIDGFRRRIAQLTDYELEPFQLESKIVVLHSKSSLDANTFQRFSKQVVVVHKMDTELGNIAEDLRCPTILNKYLSPEVIYLFEQNDLCETYHYNEDTFLFVPCPE